MRINAYLNNTPCESPIELADVGYSLSFNQTVQPDIETKSFTFTGKDKQTIDSWIAEGRIFEGIPFKIQVEDNGITLTLFDGILDFNDLVFLDPQRYEVTIKLIDGLNQLDSRTNGITFALLKDRGAINTGDYINIDYIVEKEQNLLELAMLSLSIYLITVQIAQITKDIAENGLLGASFAQSGIGGANASAFWIALSAALRIVYYALILIQLKILIEQLISFFYSPVRTHKGMYIGTMFEAVAAYLGYKFETGIDDMYKIAYLPSNLNEEGSIEEGYPNVNDYGYRVSELFDLSNKLFNTKVAVIDGTLHVRNDEDPFWDRLAEYKIPETAQQEEYRFNNNELSGANLMRFLTDITDVWTINDLDGTIFGVKTYNKTIQNEKADLIGGFSENEIPCALGNRKTGLNTVENTLKSLGKIVDELSDLVGGGTNYASQIKARIGMLKVSTQYHSVPKLLYMSGARLDVNHRNKLNAETLFKTYHKSKLFTTDNFKQQKRVYSDQLVPFGLSDINKLQKTNKAIFKGKTVNISKLVWQADQDTAIVTFEEPYIYTRNLIEIESR
jgi:hypothetical protein